MWSVVCAVDASGPNDRVCSNKFPAPARRAEYDTGERWCVTASECNAAPVASAPTRLVADKKAPCVVPNSIIAGLKSSAQNPLGDGDTEGDAEGFADGRIDGLMDGLLLGLVVGTLLGDIDGSVDGESVGVREGAEGDAVGERDLVGLVDGLSDGAAVGV